MALQNFCFCNTKEQAWSEDVSTTFLGTMMMSAYQQTGAGMMCVLGASANNTKEHRVVDL
jgi:hypothetical protein